MLIYVQQTLPKEASLTPAHVFVFPAGKTASKEGCSINFKQKLGMILLILTMSMLSRLLGGIVRMASLHLGHRQIALVAKQREMILLYLGIYLLKVSISFLLSYLLLF